MPEYVKVRLLKMRDRRITKDGIIIIKAQQYRTQERNKQDALHRLELFIQSAAVSKKIRKSTKPSRRINRRRLENKAHRGKLKSLRGRVSVPR